LGRKKTNIALPVKIATRNSRNLHAIVAKSSHERTKSRPVKFDTPNSDPSRKRNHLQ
jgi:hypothetical protein